MQTSRDVPAPDMSPDAIDLRIKELAQLWKLAMSLQTARLLGPVSEEGPAQTGASSTSRPATPGAAPGR